MRDSAPPGQRSPVGDPARYSTRMPCAPRSWLLFAPLLAGCPFVFGAPDLSNVDLSPTSVDTGTLVEDTADTDVPDFDVPTIVDFELKRFVDRIGFAFSVLDADQDYVNASITVRSDVPGSEPITFSIPSDLDEWDPLGRSFVIVPQDWLPCEGWQETWEITMTDAAGHVGPTVSADLDIEGFGLLPEGNLYDLGWIEGPTVACVEFDADPTLPTPLQEQLQSDREDMRFTAVGSGEFGFELAWEGVMDLDLLLFDERQPQYQIAPVQVVVGPGWEQYTAPLVADTVYVLSAKYFFIAGNSPPYVGTVLMGPVVE